MSWGALHWASRCRVGRAADKLILLGLAERHNEEADAAYPSVAWLCEFSSLNRKTVIASLDRLEAAGLISDSGNRTGKTSQVKVYCLHVESIPKAEQFQKRNRTVFSVKESQKRDTEPSKEPITPVSSNEDTSPAEPELKPEHVVEAWNEMAERCGLKRAVRDVPHRRRKIVTRIKSSTIQDFTEAIGAVERSTFLRGENDRGWRADIDWMLEPRNFTKLIEGVYDR